MNTPRLNFRKAIPFAIISLMLILVSAELFARAGGGGGSSGGSGGGGGGDGLIGVIIYLLLALPFPWNIIVIGGLILLGWFGNKKTKQQSVLNQMPTGNETEKIAKINSFITKNPTFNAGIFKEKVNTAFLQIQEAWMLKDMSKVRKYISDGMYQRMNTQFKMMNLLNQINSISSLRVININIDNIESDGAFDIIHAAIHASIYDKFESKAFPQLNSGGPEDFVEYWSFIRKKGVVEGNLFDTQNCPKCGAELPKNAGDVSRCDFCKTITNLGDYDWVLAEITQADDYISQHPKLSKQSNLADKIRMLVSGNRDFSTQNIEDKASNGYLQIITSQVLKDSTIMKRFVSDSLFEKMSRFDSDRIIYNRLYLNNVTLIGASQKENKNVLNILIKSSFQRVLLKDNNAVLIDPVVTSKSEIITMERDIQYENSNGSLYAHVCPSCAGPVKDTLDTNCQYCGAVLNSTKNEWIITNIMSTMEYKAASTNDPEFVTVGMNPDKADSLYDVRDIALNNVLVIMAADGAFSSEEMTMAYALAKKWGYKTDRIVPMFNMAKNNELVIRMPDDQKKREKIFRLMEKAANADGITKEEKDILDAIKMQYGIAA
jgi:ribosomal protein L40E